MKYKLINNTTKEETICNLITIDYFDYYVSITKQPKNIGELYFCSNKGKNIDVGNGIHDQTYIINKYTKNTYLCNDCKLIIATNAPDINISRIRNKADIVANNLVNAFLNEKIDDGKRFFWKVGFRFGYNKAKETYRYTKEDLYNLAKHITHNYNINAWVNVKCGDISEQNVPTNKIVEEWVEQQLTTIYYE